MAPWGYAPSRRTGGVTIVQDPTEALFDGMPRAALRHARIEYTLAVDDIALVLARLARGADEDGAERGGAMVDAINDRDDDEVALAVIRRDMGAQARDERSAATTVYTCPECGGTLWQVDHAGSTRFYCHVGHSYGAEALLGQMSEELEAALWRSVRLLEEKATLTRQLGGRMRANGQDASAAAVEEQADLDDSHNRAIRDTLLENVSTPAMQALAVTEAWENAGGGAAPRSHDGDGWPVARRVRLRTAGGIRVRLPLLIPIARDD